MVVAAASPKLPGPCPKLPEQPELQEEEPDMSLTSVDAANGTTGDELAVTEEKKVKPVSFFKLLKFASGPELALLIIGNLFGLAMGFVQVYMVVTFGDVQDSLIMGDTDLTNEFVMTFVYLAIAAFCVCWVMNSTTSIFAELQKEKFRIKYIEAVLRQDVTWFDENTPGTLPERMTGNVEAIAMGIGDKTAMFTMDISMAMFGLIFGFKSWWAISLCVLACVPFMALGGAFMGKAMADLQTENQSWYHKASAIAEEVLNGVRTVVAFRGERKECARFENQLQSARQGGVRAQLKVGIGMGYATDHVWRLCSRFLCWGQAHGRWCHKFRRRALPCR
jgi:ABC-type multidrug transport system fused ATPase/permease subunit